MGEVSDPPGGNARRQLERLIFFSDAVFAIAITLLVLDLKAPIGPHGEPDLEKVVPNVVGFLLSFYVIGIYWQAHHALFGCLQAEDARLRRVNLAFLATIAFLPFPTSVIAQFPSSPRTTVFYAASAGAVGLAQAALALAARRPDLLTPAERDLPVLPWVVRPLMATVVFGLSIPAALFWPQHSSLLWLLILPARWMTRRFGARSVDQTAAAR